MADTSFVIDRKQYIEKPVIKNADTIRCR